MRPDNASLFEIGSGTHRDAAMEEGAKLPTMMSVVAITGRMILIDTGVALSFARPNF